MQKQHIEEIKSLIKDIERFSDENKYHYSENEEGYDHNEQMLFIYSRTIMRICNTYYK